MPVSPVSVSHNICEQINTRRNTQQYIVKIKTRRNRRKKITTHVRELSPRNGIPFFLLNYTFAIFVFIFIGQIWSERLNDQNSLS